MSMLTQKNANGWRLLQLHRQSPHLPLSASMINTRMRCFKSYRYLATVSTKKNKKLTFREHEKRMKEIRSLYRVELERDSCGVALYANMRGIPSREIVTGSNEMLSRMAHRGGTGSEKNTGDGAGMLVGLPDSFLRSVAQQEVGITLPEQGEYAAGMIFFSTDQQVKGSCKDIFEKQAKAVGLDVLGWRVVPTNNSTLGETAKIAEPDIEQIFLANSAGYDADKLELQLLLLRKNVASEILAKNLEDFYVCSLSARTMTYKGQLTPDQLNQYYLDLNNPLFTTHMAMVHSRFSTNTFPSWDRAQPNRMLCHNGEINTLRGNKNWMEARSRKLFSPLLTEKEQTGLLPICSDDMTDSGNFDSVLELLSRASGRSVTETIMMLIPEAWQNNPYMTASKRAFYEYNSCVMEPWDGPAMMAFTDGRYLGAVLDRNGLRPSRFYVTNDDHVILSSEVGVLPELNPDVVKQKGRLEPGKMFLVDFNAAGLVHDNELKEDLASKRDYVKWVSENLSKLSDLTVPGIYQAEAPTEQELRQSLNVFGYTTETLDLLLTPMAATGKEGLGSMGVDTPLAVLSENPKQISEYFKQLFAQVTNPPIDPIREEIVMSLACPVGPEGNLLEVNAECAKRLVIDEPVITEDALETLKAGQISDWKSFTIDAVYNPKDGADGLRKALNKISEQVTEAVRNGTPVIIVSHRNVNENLAPIPSLMVTGCLHHHLIGEKLRTEAALVVECGDAREVHDFCTLVGFGADAICPYIAYDAIRSLNQSNRLNAASNGVNLSDEEVVSNYRKAAGKGMLKVMAKMGISTVQSYKGAQIFEAVGLDSEVVDKCFRGTTSRIEGAGFESIAKDISSLHQLAFPENSDRIPLMRNPGDYHYRHGGETHQNDPAAMADMQYAVRNSDPAAWKRYVEYTSQQNQKASLRGLLGFNMDPSNRVSIDEVEPASEIMKRFVTGAMSLGSISAESHEALGVAMNRIGGRSNTGEGGEDPARYVELPTGDSKRSAIKQVASGRFGVTAEYLVNSDQIQIKMAQGAKPGEGGELPGYKVTEEIASVRGTTPGVGLISPPPHHDIYSIEDLAQLIHDLKNSNPEGTVSVKLVSEVGVGIVAAGVAKAKADHIVVSGGDGGTGAAAWTGIHRAGIPWELGIAESQQTLVVNNLRSRVRFQADGQMKTGRDVVIAALLGAEEFGFSTAPLIAMGCIMMRKCHLNTCPVGIATQDPELRKKFIGTPEHVQNFFYYLAEDIRHYMASLGVKRFRDLIGRTDLLHVRDDCLNYKTKGLDLSPLLVAGKDLNPQAVAYHIMDQDHELEAILDHTLIAKAAPAISNGTPVHMTLECNNLNRSTGTLLSSRIAKKYGAEGLPDNTINIKLVGSAGQSLGFILMKGVTIEVEGDANDGVGKGMCGGRIIVSPHKSILEKGYKAEENVIIGNVALYGATSGEAYFRGIAGERFCVRNSGGSAVVEGVGDHGCEYMTGGRVVILGETGRNFAAGMSGGIAYVYDPDGKFSKNCNMEMVGLERVETNEEADDLLSLIENHRRYTSSTVAGKVISNWENCLPDFVKVMPHDYKRVLEELKAKESETEPLVSSG